MSKPSADLDAITCVLPVHNPGKKLESAITAWFDTLKRLGREFEILIVNDGSTDDTAGTAAKIAERNPRLRILTHDARRGYGACLRTAIAEAQHPLLVHATGEHEFNPADLEKLLERIDIKDELTGRSPTLISGCRVGKPAPGIVRTLGKCWRMFCRLVLGLPLQPPVAWPGLRGLAYSYLVWLVFGVPFTDPNSPFRLWRTEFLKRVPIQSDSDFVHVELAGKATFLTCILDEVPLTPNPAVPRVASVWCDFWRVLRNPDFGRPTLPS